MPGRLIVVEGLDGTGKSTFSRELARRLGAWWTTTPGPLLRESRAAVESGLGPDPLARQLFYAATVAAESARVAPRLRAGETVVMDRYWATTVAYARLHPAYMELPDIERRLVPAHTTWFLSLDERERRRRLEARGTSAGDRDTFDVSVRAALNDSYREALTRPVCGRVHHVDVSRLGQGQLWDGWADA
jgi:dTMP kinase